MIVLPYSDLLNSGVLFYGLSRFRPVVAPRRGSIPEVQGQVGDQWLCLFDGEFGPDALRDAIDWLRRTSRNEPPDLSQQDWVLIGRNVAQFLKDVMDRRA